MLDTSQNLIVINGCIRTAQIERCRYEAPNKYYIVFAGNPKEYAYRADKVWWLRNPEALNPTDYRLVHNERRLTHIARYSDFETIRKPIGISDSRTARREATKAPTYK